MNINNLDKLTLQERVDIAKCMVSPRRCGGLYYYEGKEYYKAGTHFVPGYIYRLSDSELNYWFDNHNHEHCEFLWTQLMRLRNDKSNI